jgi:hypothetical protein
MVLAMCFTRLPQTAEEQRHHGTLERKNVDTAYLTTLYLRTIIPVLLRAHVPVVDDKWEASDLECERTRKVGNIWLCGRVSR